MRRAVCGFAPSKSNEKSDNAQPGGTGQVFCALLLRNLSYITFVPIHLSIYATNFKLQGMLGNAIYVFFYVCVFLRGLDVFFRGEHVLLNSFCLLIVSNQGKFCLGGSPSRDMRWPLDKKRRLSFISFYLPIPSSWNANSAQPVKGG